MGEMSDVKKSGFDLSVVIRGINMQRIFEDDGCRQRTVLCLFEKAAWCFVLLLLLASFAWSADAAGQRETGQAQEQRIAAKAPQTAEELLVCIRDFLVNPNMDGFSFVEKVTGKHKENWGTSPIQTGLAKNPDVRWMRFYGSGRFKELLPVPYKVNDFGLEESTYRLMYIELVFYDFSRGKKPDIDDDDYLLALTPEMTRKVFGPPDKLDVASPREYGRYSVYYTYMRGRYELEVFFWAPGDNDRQLINERLKHSDEQINQERTRRKLFENHKDFRAVRMKLKSVTLNNRPL